MADQETEISGPVISRAERRRSAGREALRRAMHRAGNIGFALLMLVMCFLVVCLLQSRIKGGAPTVAGHRLYIVLSDSMVPAFRAGSMAAVRPVEPGSLRVGDVITYRDPLGGANSITHRITAVQTANGLTFTTRGDANNIDDAAVVPAANVIGRVTAVVPWAGYLAAWSRTGTGVLVLVIMPGLLIIALELKKLLYYAAALKIKKKERDKAAAGPDDGEEAQPHPPV